MVEENAAARRRGERETDQGVAAEPGLWGENFERLKKQGLTAEQIAAALPHVRVEPVLTAHPTEAKRATVLEQHRAMYRLLERSERDLTPAERSRHDEEMRAALERLWRTGEILLNKPDVTAERANLLFYLREVFPDALEGLDRRLRQAWAAAGFDLALVQDPDHLPSLNFGLWAGGDRDGHPGVTPALTRDTFDELRRGAVDTLSRKLDKLAERLSLSQHVQNPPPELLARIAELAERHPKRYARIKRRGPEEPWRQLAGLCLAHLPRTDDLDGPAFYAHGHELVADLRLLRRTLLDAGARRLVETDLDPVLRCAKLFGFHLAALDIRQNSAYHDRALSQLLANANVPDAESWGEWSEERRLELLDRELKVATAVQPVGPQHRGRGGRRAGDVPRGGRSTRTPRAAGRRGTDRQHDVTGQRSTCRLCARKRGGAGPVPRRPAAMPAAGGAAVRDDRRFGAGAGDHASVPGPPRDAGEF